MAMLLAMFQKMKLTREINQLSLKQMQYSTKLERVTKNIARVQEMFTSRIANLENQAKRESARATSVFQTAVGMGANCVGSFNGFNNFIMNNMWGMLGPNGQGFPVNNQAIKLDQNTFNNLLNAYQMGQLRPNNEGKYVINNQNIPETQVNAFMGALQTAQMNQQSAQMWVQQQSQMAQDNISIWVENEKAILEAQQEAMLEPLSYQETMLTLDKDHTDTMLQKKRQELETYKQLCSEEAKNSAPTFGLG